MKYSDPRLVDQLAASYVLGTLAPRARRRFERLQRDRRDVAMAVGAWEARLGRLAQSVAPVTPSSRVWDAIAQRTRPEASVQARKGFSWLLPAGLGLGGVAAGVLATIGLLATAPALFVTADQVAMRTGGKLPHSYVGLLTDAQGNGKLLVSSLRHGRAMTVKVIGPIEPRAAGRKLVLWAMPASGAPFVLGTVPLTGSATTQLPDTSEKLLSKVSKLMVTEEAVDTPATPGPVVFTGNCAKLW
jgi:anti-sigma-K factor RskA